MREELVRVERFEELRAGMLVVYKPCSVCGGNHRALLLTVATGWLHTGGSEPSISMLPQPGCREPGDWAIGPTTVSAGKVYRVVDDLEASSPETTTRRHPKPARVGR